MFSMTPTQTPEVGHDPLLHLPVDEIKPSPENDLLYGPINPADPSIKDLARDIHQRGILEPLVLTPDRFILSGHRRYAAARLAGLKSIPCRIDWQCYHDDPGFLARLAAYNKQRVKDRETLAREVFVDAVDPEKAYQELKAYRRQRAGPTDSLYTINPGVFTARKAISAAKSHLLNAILKILEMNRDYWPLSDRKVHYGLCSLPVPPLRHASKPDSTYLNTLACYKDCCNLLTRARVSGIIPMDAIDDATRTSTAWKTHAQVGDFVRTETDRMFKQYCRDLLQSQPRHIEIVGEKLTLDSVLRRVSFQYTVPYSIGRGFSSLPLRHKVASRFQATGKDRLTVLFLSDADPDGEEIAASFIRSLRDDFDIKNVEGIKVALRPDQAQQMQLPTALQVKAKSSRTPGYVRKWKTTDVWELEALPSDVLERMLRESIEAVLDRKAFAAEVEQEKKDAAHLTELRRKHLSLLGEL